MHLGGLPMVQGREVRTDVRRELLEAAERGEPSQWTTVKNSYESRTEYYTTMMANVRSEFLDQVVEAKKGGGLLLQGSGSGSCGSLDCHCEFTLGPIDRSTTRTAAEHTAWVAERAAELEQLKDNVVMATGGFGAAKLYWITRCEVEVIPATQSTRESVVVRGQGMSSSGSALQHIGSPTNFQVLLFAGDFASRYRAASDLCHGVAPTPQLEAAVLNPGKLVPGTFATRTRKSLEARLHKKVMPINPVQFDAIFEMKHRVEIIHGPPGTGKSTTIFHALSGHLPDAAAAIVTCVCNQAVDAVAEKLADVQEPSRKGCLPMLVLGHPSRVGRTAGQYVLDAQAKCEELVVFMRHICDDVLKKRVDGMRKVQNLRINKFLGGHTDFSKSRLSGQQLHEVRGLKARVLAKLLEEHDASFMLARRRLATEPELVERWQLLQRQRSSLAQISLEKQMLKEHLNVVSKVRRAMAAAAAAFLPVDVVHGRSKYTAEAMATHERTLHADITALDTQTFCRGMQVQQRWVAILKAGTQAGDPLWSIGSHLISEAKRLKIAERWLAFAVDRAPHRVIRRTRVFLCTIPSSYKIGMLKEDYPEDFTKRLFVAICDEAAATAETYVPQMLQLAVENLILLGDHKQLQPLVLAIQHKVPEQKQVSRSLMERTLHCGYQARMLKTQYRMFESLCTIVSDLFYGGKVVTAPEKLAQDAEEEQQQVPGTGGRFKRGAQVEICSDDWTWNTAVVKRAHPSGGYFVDCDGETVWVDAEWIRAPEKGTQVVFKDARERLRWFDCAAWELPVGNSFVNVAEAAKIRELLLKDPVLSKTRERVKVISLYKPQLQLLQLVCADIVKRRANIEFVTVDACQGTEAPHIMLSPVRTNYGRIGFTANPRRLNVAISRAIKSLTIVGSGNALSCDKNWSKVYAGVRKMGIVTPVDTNALKKIPAANWGTIAQEAQEMAEKRASKAPEPVYHDHFGYQPRTPGQGKGKGKGKTFDRAREFNFFGKGKAGLHMAKGTGKGKGKGQVAFAGNGKAAGGKGNKGLAFPKGSKGLGVPKGKGKGKGTLVLSKGNGKSVILKDYGAKGYGAKDGRGKGRGHAAPFGKAKGKGKWDW